MQFFPNSILQTGVKDIGPSVSKPFNVGLRLLAITVCQVFICYLTHRYREQAKAYRVMRCTRVR
jgi:hypothetical protein